MSTTVTYKGNTLATVSNNTKTLKTAGKYMEGDVVLTDVSAGAPNVWQDENGYVHLDDEGSSITWETIYDDSVEIFSSSPNYFQIIPYTTAFEANQTYRVTWGQTQYLCNTITDSTSITYDGYLMGNLNIVGMGTDTGEPFIIYRNSATELTGGTSQSTGTVSLKIELQHQSGGSVSVEPLSVTQNGTYTAPTGKAYSPVTVNVSGGSSSISKKQINFIDYDGTILHSYTKSEWQSVTALPSNPSHTGLTAQGWNWTKTQIDAQLTAVPNGDVWVGQMYITTSGDTEIDVKFVDSTRLSPYLSCAVKGEITIDWGDNSTSTVIGTSLTSRKDTQHVYASIGNYTITIHVESGSWAFYGSSTYTLLNKNSSTANTNRVYSNCVQNVRIGANTSIGSSAFSYCHSLASVTIPSSVTSIGSSAFNYCYSLASATIPSSVTSIGNNVFNYCCSLANVTIPSGITSFENSMFNYCYSLASVTIPSSVMSIGSSVFYYCSSLVSVTIPSSVTSIGNNVFYYCYSLANVTIPSGITSVGSNLFYSCYSLANMTIPSSVTSIENSAFYNCYGMAEYHIKPTMPPTLGTTVFSNIQSDCVIYVPSASLTAYQTVNDWSTYASYMQGE